MKSDKKVIKTKKSKKQKEIYKYPINNKFIKDSSITKDWLSRVENFQKNAIYDYENKYHWIFAKDMQKSPRNPNFGADKKYYPPASIMIEFRQFDIKTNRENKAYKIYEEDYLYGLAIYQQKFKIDYIKKITNFEYKQLEQKIITSKWLDDVKLKKLLILDANVNQLKFYISDNKNDRNNNLFHLLNLIVSLREIFDKDIKSKLTINYWDFSENQEIIKKSDWEVIKILESTPYINNSKINLWKKVKTLRDLWTHYYNYIPNPCGEHRNATTNCICDIKNYILLKIIFWNDDFYFFITELIQNSKKLIIIKYNFINIKNILNEYLKDILNQN